MADNAIIKIMTALLKHQVKKVVGDETLGVLGKELAGIGGDKVDGHLSSWLGNKKNEQELEKAALYAHGCFQKNIDNDELFQWMVSLPLGDLPKVTEAINKLPLSPDEKELENALRESIATNWKKLSKKQAEDTIDTFLKCMRGALLPIEKQTMLVIGRSVLRTEDKVDLLIDWFEQYIIRREKETKGAPKEEPSWHLKHRYALTGNFTGRETEIETLTDWLETKEEPLFILRALGGFGKSALIWHWLLNKVDRPKWTKALWWSFYEGDASFQNFLDDTLKYLLGEDVELPSTPRLQVEMLLKALEEEGILLVLDGFERVLRAYSGMSAAYQEDDENKKYDERDFDCVSPAADDFLRKLASSKGIIQAKVLMTTRLRPRAVEMRGNLLNGCLENELTELSKEDAVALFKNQDIKGTRAEIEATCAPYGYHPLTLSILAGYILGNRSKPNDVSIAATLNITDDIIQNKHHVLEVAYNSLLPEEQKLLSTIACFRSPTSYEALQFIAESPLPEGEGQGEGEILDSQLAQLETRGILHWDKASNKYDLHPIVRRYAYERLTAPDRTAAHTRLRDYFAAVPEPEKIESLNDLAPVIELYHHMVRAGQFDEAFWIFHGRLNQATYYQFGAYQLRIELMRALFIDGEDKPPRLKEESAQAWTLNGLANSYSLNGEPRRSVPVFEQAIKMGEEKGDKKNLAIRLGNVAGQQLVIGALGDAERNLHRQIDICEQSELDKSQQPGIHYELARVLCYLSRWDDAEREFKEAEKIKKDHTQAQGVISAHRSLRALLMARDTNDVKLKTEYCTLAIESAQRALELADEWARTEYPLERDYVRAYWVLGASHRASGSLEEAEKHLSESLRRCRAINSVDAEADILLENSKLLHAQEKHEQALNYAEEALTITERSGYVLQGADVHIWLARLAVEGIVMRDEVTSEEDIVHKTHDVAHLKRFKSHRLNGACRTA